MNISISGSKTDYSKGYETRELQKNKFEKKYVSQKNDNTSVNSDTSTNTNASEQIPSMDIYNMMNQTRTNIARVAQEKGKEESKTDTDIIVKSDGSRVVVITTSLGGMETTMSLEISKPTAMQNESSKENNSNLEQNIETDMLSNEMVNGATEA